MLLIILLYFLYYIQTLHQKGNLIPEPYPGELNQLFQTAINPQPPPLHTHTHTTWNDQSCYSLQLGHYCSLPAHNFQSTANQVMYLQFEIHNTN